MKTKFAVLALFLAAATVHAQDWSFGAGAGAFAPGGFVERTLQIGTETQTTSNRLRLSASTRPGGTVDIQRDATDWLAFRLAASYASAPLAVKNNRSSSGTATDAGRIKIATLALPVVISLNRHGSFRFAVMGGPAAVRYELEQQATSTGALPLFSGSRTRIGAMAGGEVTWWLSQRFAFQANVTDTVTASPLERTDFPATTRGVRLVRPNNLSSIAGIRYRF